MFALSLKIYGCIFSCDDGVSLRRETGGNDVQMDAFIVGGSGERQGRCCEDPMGFRLVVRVASRHSSNPTPHAPTYATSTNTGQRIPTTPSLSTQPMRLNPSHINSICNLPPNWPSSQNMKQTRWQKSLDFQPIGDQPRT